MKIAEVKLRQFNAFVGEVLIEEFGHRWIYHLAAILWPPIG